jgi:hypothetical protein
MYALLVARKNLFLSLSGFCLGCGVWIMVYYLSSIKVVTWIVVTYTRFECRICSQVCGMCDVGLEGLEWFGFA